MFYDNERKLSRIEINDCSFKGKLINGAHHIDGISTDDEKSNLIIKACKFDSDQDGALNRKLFNVDLRNQVLFNNKLIRKQLHSSLWLTISSMAAVLIIIVTLVIKKQNNEAQVQVQESIEA